MAFKSGTRTFPGVQRTLSQQDLQAFQNSLQQVQQSGGQWLNSLSQVANSVGNFIRTLR